MSRFYERIKLRYKAGRLWIQEQFCKKSGSKTVLEITLWGNLIVIFFLTLLICWVIYGNMKQNATSFNNKTDRPIVEDKEDSSGSNSMKNLISSLPILGEKSRNRKKQEEVIEYPSVVGGLSSRQVIVREEAALSRGQKDWFAIGKTTMRFDSSIEGNQKIRVLIPYGLSDEAAKLIPPMSVVEGSAQAEGKDDRVFMNFTKAYLPDGRVLKIEAEALSSADYSPGVKGEFHSEGDIRVASGLALTMVSGISSGLTDKVALAEGVVGVGSGLKNALLQGLSDTTKMEAERQMEQLGEMEGYLTLEAESDLIVSFNNIEEMSSDGKN